jgi:hypothetical protein
MVVARERRDIKAAGDKPACRQAGSAPTKPIHPPRGESRWWRRGAPGRRSVIAARRGRRNAMGACGVYGHSSRRHARILGGVPDVPDHAAARFGFRAAAARRALTRRNAS